MSDTPQEPAAEEVIDAADEAYMAGDDHLHWRTCEDRTDEDVRLVSTGEVIFTGDADECWDFMHRARLSAAIRIAYQRGRLAGREEAAKHLEAVASHWDAEDDCDYAAAMRMAARFVRGESHTLPQDGG